MAQAGGLGKIYEAYKAEVEFFFVYITEAHPNKIHPQPKTMEERLKNAVDLRDKKKWPLPIIVDDITNPALKTYGCHPARAVLVSKEGNVLWSSPGSPRGGSAAPLLDALKKAFPDVKAPELPAARGRGRRRPRRR